jgi:hypothetical protein
VVVVVKDLFSLLADVQNGLHSCDWVLPSESLSSQHDAVNTVQHCIGHICSFRPAKSKMSVKQVVADVEHDDCRSPQLHWPPQWLLPCRNRTCRSRVWIHTITNILALSPLFMIALASSVASTLQKSNAGQAGWCKQGQACFVPAQNKLQIQLMH